MKKDSAAMQGKLGTDKAALEQFGEIAADFGG